MPKYTLEHIRQVARNKDPRLEDVKKYPDSWIDDKIHNAFETAESGRQVFATEEILDLEPYINDDVEEFLFEASEEVHNFTDIISSVDGVSAYVNNDDTVSVTMDIDALKKLTKPKTLTFRYFFVPSVNFDEIFMKSEVYHYFRHCLYVNIYGSLRDKENEMYHQQQVDRFIADGSFGIQNNFDEFITEKNNFSTIGTSSWE